MITSNYLRFVEIDVKNNTLQIDYKRNQPMENVDTKIVIYAKEVKSVSAGIGSIVKIKDNFELIPKAAVSAKISISGLLAAFLIII